MAAGVVPAANMEGVFAPASMHIGRGGVFATAENRKAAESCAKSAVLTAPAQAHPGLLLLAPRRRCHPGKPIDWSRIRRLQPKIKMNY